MQPENLDQFEDLMVATVTLKNPVTGAPLAATVDLLGPENPVRRNLVFARSRQLRAEYQRTGKPAATDPAEDFETETQMMSQCIAGWQLQFGGVPLDYSPAAALQLLSDPKRQWIRTQVKKAIDDSTRFIKDSTQT